MEEKIYFIPGDLVQLRQNLPNKPIMMVVRKETALIKQKSEFLSRPMIELFYFLEYHFVLYTSLI